MHLWFKFMYFITSTKTVMCGHHNYGVQKSSCSQQQDYKLQVTKEMDIPVIDLTPYVDVKSAEFCSDEVPSHEVEKICLEVSRI